MPSGLFVSDCTSSDWAWLDIGCGVQAVGTDIGNAVGGLVGGATAPLWTPLLVLLIAVVIVIAIIAFSPNVKHIVPHIGLG